MERRIETVYVEEKYQVTRSQQQGQGGRRRWRLLYNRAGCMHKGQALLHRFLDLKMYSCGDGLIRQCMLRQRKEESKERTRSSPQTLRPEASAQRPSLVSKVLEEERINSDRCLFRQPKCSEPWVLWTRRKRPLWRWQQHTRIGE